MRCIALIYAASTVVHGTRRQFAGQPANEQPVNIYAFSKLAFDNYVQARPIVCHHRWPGCATSTSMARASSTRAVMASVIRHFHGQLAETGTCRLFKGCDGYGDGEQRRDFIHVGDCVAVHLRLYDHDGTGGRYATDDCPAGRAVA